MSPIGLGYQYKHTLPNLALTLESHEVFVRYWRFGKVGSFTGDIIIPKC